MFQFLALGRIVLGDEDRVGRDGTPESLGLERGDFERFFEGDSVEIDIDDAGGVVGVEQDIDSGELSDGAVDHVRLAGKHLDGDGGVGDGGHLDGSACLLQTAHQAARWACCLRGRIGFVVDHLERAVAFLLGEEEGGIDRHGFLEGGQGFVEFAVVAQLLTVVNDGGGGLKAAAFEGGPVAQIFGLEVVGLLVELVGGFVILASLRVLTLGVQILGLVGGNACESYCRDQQQQ